MDENLREVRYAIIHSIKKAASFRLVSILPAFLFFSASSIHHLSVSQLETRGKIILNYLKHVLNFRIRL